MSEAYTEQDLQVAYKTKTYEDIATEFSRIRSEARAGMREACESLNRDLVSMVAYRHALREVTENLLKYVEDVYPRCPESSRRELEEADRRKRLIAEANAILHETALTPADEAIERIEQKAREVSRLIRDGCILRTGHFDIGKSDTFIAAALQSAVADVWEEAAKEIRNRHKLFRSQRVAIQFADEFRARGQKETA